MTAREVAQLFNARKTGKGKWVALCSAHPDRQPSMTISEGKNAVMIRCWSQGCDIQDICRAAGIKVEALWYESRIRQDPKERARLEKDRIQAEATEYRGRIRNWIILFKNEGYKNRAGDVKTAIACAIMLAGGYDKEHIRRMLRNAMERLTAHQIMEMADARVSRPTSRPS